MKAKLIVALGLTFTLNLAYGHMTQYDSTGKDSTAVADRIPTYPSQIAAGEFTPGKGFLMVKNKFASLNISMYAMARYVNQMPGEDTWADHRDSIRTFDGRNDIYWHRVMIWFTGYVGTPKLTYMATVWTVFTTQQTLVYGNIKYAFNKHFSVGIGINTILVKIVT